MKTYQIKNKLIEVYQDDNAESPDDWGDSSSFLVFQHNQFNVEKEWCSAKDVYVYLRDKEKGNVAYNDYYIFPVSAYIHSGVFLSLEKRQGFDISNTGFILIDKTEKEWNYQQQRESNPELVNKTNEEIARVFAEGLIENWNTYLSGQVYVLMLYKTSICSKCKTIHKEELDSIGGIYINSSYTIEDAIADNFSLDIKKTINLKNY